MEQNKIAFSGELMLAGWGETHTGGAKVTFWLPDAASLDAFRHMTSKKGNTAGQRFMAVLVELDENDQPKPQDRDKPRVGPLCSSALVLCRTEEFQRFASFFATSAVGVSAEDHAAEVIKDFCGVDSRKELDSIPSAATQFSRLMSEYRSWARG